MPMFYTPKPRQFRYKPRFYDPEKERWDALKQKYADERMIREMEAELEEVSDLSAKPEVSDSDLEYFQQRVREIDSREREKQRGLTWRDLFRKREMPTFNYTPRFNSSSDNDVVQKQGTGEHINNFKKQKDYECSKNR